MEKQGPGNKVQDLEDAIRRIELPGRETDADRQKWRTTMLELGVLLQKRYELTGEPEILEQVIEIADTVHGTSLMPEPDEACWLHFLTVHLMQRSVEAQDPNMLSKSFKFAQQCVAITGSGHPHHVFHRILLVEVRHANWKQTDDPNHLDQAIDEMESILGILSADDENMDKALMLMRKCYKSRFEKTKLTKDIDSIVLLTKRLAQRIPIDDPRRSCGFHQLSQELHRHFEHSKYLLKLNEAIEIMELAVSVTPVGHEHTVLHLVALGKLLERRFRETDQVNNISDAIDIAERVIKVTPEGDEQRCYRLHQLGERLGMRFNRTGLMHDLDRAIEEIMKSIMITPTVDPDRSGPLNCLAIWLGRRFEVLGSTEDLKHAVENASLAVAITAPRHTRYGMNCNTLANLLAEQFARTPDLLVLDKAIEAAEAALNECLDDSPERSCRLHGLAEHLKTRYQHRKSPEDLKRAMECAMISVKLTPGGHPHLSIHLDGHAKLLESRFLEDGVPADLHDAIMSARRAVRATPPDHLHAAELLETLGTLLKRRYELLDDQDDYEQSLLYFQRGWDCTNAPPSVRIQAASNAAELLAAKSNWAESSLLLQKAVELLPLVSPRSLDHVDKQYALGEFSGLAARAAACVLSHGNCAYDALKLLELGRNVIAGHLLDIRTDIFAVEELDKDLAEKFVILRDELDTGLTAQSAELDDTPFSWEARSRRRQEADQEFQEVIQKIRSCSGFANFLRPPTAEEMQAAALHGPIVVVNASPYRCDAFIVEVQQIRLLGLDLTLKDINTNVEKLGTNGLSTVLEWSWATIARPILTTLGLDQPISDGKWSRLWWVLTGPLSHLPMHAAGYHDQGHGETVLDRVVSSYASSVKSILYNQSRRFKNATENTKGNAVLVSMPDTPDHSTLDFTATEIVEVARLCPPLKLKAVMPNLRKDDVLRHLSSCETFHFAGHGMSDPFEPSKSRLYLQDWKDNPLTVGDLRELNLRATAPWLGYLSACSTGEIRANKLVDETIHLVSACQLAGFRHVVGTLWAVSDEYCVEAAKGFYEYLCDHERTDFVIAKALHTTVRAIRDRSMATRPMTASGAPTPTGTLSSQATSQVEVVYEAIDVPLDAQDDHSKITDGRAGTRRQPHVYARTFHWVPYIHFGV